MKNKFIHLLRLAIFYYEKRTQLCEMLGYVDINQLFRKFYKQDKAECYFVFSGIEKRIFTFDRCVRKKIRVFHFSNEYYSLNYDLLFSQQI